MKLKTLILLFGTIQIFADSYALDKSFVYLNHKNNEELFASASRQTSSLYQLADYTVANPSVVFQQKNVTGRVTDSNGNPLAGATIIEKGTTNGVVVAMDGKYSISVNSGNSILVFSMVGFATQELAIGSQNSINVTLAESIVDLEEVVVVGYGSQKKATITGSIAVIGTKSLLQSPQANLSNALVGRLTGVIARQQSGEPGFDQSTLRIRGVGTFAGSQDPLIIIDGIESTTYNNIDPNEIENISILKDASATAVYGVRGANGVMLITTKRGKTGKPQISFTSNFATTNFVNLRHNMRSYDYAKAWNEAMKYDSYISGVYTPKYTDSDLQFYKDHTDPIFHPDVDWPGLMLKKNTSQSQNNLNISGGAENIKYFVSAGTFNQEGLFNNTTFNPNFDAQIKYKRYNFRSNFDFNVSKRLLIVVNLSTQIEDRNGPSNTTTILERLLGVNPLRMSGIIDGKFVYPVNSTYAANLNPLAVLIDQGYRKTYNNYLNGSARFNYLLDYVTQGLSTHMTLSYQTFNSNLKTYSTPTIPYVASRLSDNTVVFIPQGVEAPFSFSESNNKNRKTYLEFGLDYTRKFGDHNVTGLLLYNQNKYFSPSLTFLVPNGYQGLVGRVTYDYKSRYLAEFNFGYNGTENFAPDKRYGFFPAYSLGWVFSEEPFFPENDYVSFMKFRGSYGEVGNDQVGGDRFLYRPTAYSYSGSYYFGEVGTTYQTYSVSNEGKLGNPNLTWERAKKTDIGIELKLFNDKITISADWFNEKRDNILANRLSPPNIVGASLPAYNLGKMKNTGFDGDVSYNGRIRSLNYWFKFNFTYAHNVVLEMDEVPKPYSYLNLTGQRFNQFQGLIAEGLFNTWEEVNDPKRPLYIWQNDRIQPGDIRYKDVNGDGKIDLLDMVPIGYSNFPEKTFGFSFGGNFRGFDISVFFQGATNVSIPCDRRAMKGWFEEAGAIDYLINSWSHERYEQGLPILFPHYSVGEDFNKANYINYGASTFWIRDGSYLRLKTAEMGYTFSGNLLKKVKISSFRIYINGSNLITWSKLWAGEDPESFQTNVRDVGTQNYPITRTVNMGLNVQF